jgi:hypothetical protein
LYHGKSEDENKKSSCEAFQDDLQREAEEKQGKSQPHSQQEIYKA